MSIESIIATIEHNLRERGLFPMADTPETIDSRVRLRIMLDAIFEGVEAHYAAREAALLRMLGGNFENCSIELLERASVKLALAAMRASPVPVEPNRADEIEKRLARVEALIEALIGPTSFSGGELVFRNLDGSTSKVDVMP